MVCWFDAWHIYIHKVWHQQPALAPRPLVIYCAYSSILTLQQSYALNEVQDSTYGGT
jgi:hypothetical protein